MVDAVRIASIKCQTFDFFGDDLRALHSLRQQAAVASADGRIFELQSTYFQNGLGYFCLARKPDL